MTATTGGVDTAALPVLGIAQTALETMAALQIGALSGAVPVVKAAVEASPYWRQFCELARAGKVEPGFLNGSALESCVLGWAGAA